MRQQDERNKDGQLSVLYVTFCPTCRHCGEAHLRDDTHDGGAATCAACGGPVTLEWDGGVTLKGEGRS